MRVLAAISLVVACAAVSGCAGGAEANGRQKKPSALVLTSKDVGAPRTDQGRTDLLGETPEDDMNSALPQLSSGRPTWHAFFADFHSVSIDSLAATFPSSDNAKALLRLAPRLARYEGMGGGSVVRSVPIGDAAVLVHGGILTPAGQPEQGAAVVFRKGAVVGQVIAPTDAVAIRLAKVQAAKAG